ncbi:hypothetical protein F5888DRAFT_841391 [Russula emetica]|nr:hypothetical protein F5888DRAFT_841391 [Russula emetica]
MILERHTTVDQLSKETEAGSRKLASTSSAPEDSPPAYSQATQATQTTSSGSSPSQVTRVVSLSRTRQGVVPFGAPINGLEMYTKRDSIRGSWSLDPQAPKVPAQDLVQMILDGRGEKKRFGGCLRSKKKVPPTAMFRSRHGTIHATFRVVGESALRTVATIHSKSRGGNIFLDVASIAPMRTVHIDASSRRGNITLLIPRSFSGLVQLSSRHGTVEMLPALAASCRVIKGRKKETTVLLGDGPMPAVGSDIITDTARIHSRRGRVWLGFSGEDYVTETPGLMDQAIRLMQKLIMPSSQKSH